MQPFARKARWEGGRHDRRQPRRQTGKNRPPPLIFDLLATPLFFVLFMFLPAGTSAWTKGWLFVVVFVALGVLASLFMRKVNPDLLAARINAHQGGNRGTKCSSASSCDGAGDLSGGGTGRQAVSMVSRTRVGQPTWLRSATDRYGASDLGGGGEQVLRADGPHPDGSRSTVVDTGPYAMVRRPGCVCGCRFPWARPCPGLTVGVDPRWSFDVGADPWRAMESQALRQGPGYKEYTEQVRYRIVPWVWWMQASASYWRLLILFEAFPGDPHAARFFESGHNCHSFLPQACVPIVPAACRPQAAGASSSLAETDLCSRGKDLTLPLGTPRSHCT